MISILSSILKHRFRCIASSVLAPKIILKNSRLLYPILEYFTYYAICYRYLKPYMHYLKQSQWQTLNFKRFNQNYSIRETHPFSSLLIFSHSGFGRDSTFGWPATKKHYFVESRTKYSELSLTDQ